MTKIYLFLMLVLLGIPGGQAVAADRETAPVADTLKAGMASPDFRYRDVNGKVVTLKSLKGKYVYIDVWATWCGPCCAEIPYLKKLEQKLHGKKIVFVSMSVDENRSVWQKFVKEREMGGVQLNAEGNETFMEAYRIKGIPRFILLDKKGKIVDADMTRPSDPKTLERLLKLKGI